MFTSIVRARGYDRLTGAREHSNIRGPVNVKTLFGVTNRRRTPRSVCPTISPPGKGEAHIRANEYHPSPTPTRPDRAEATRIEGSLERQAAVYRAIRGSGVGEGGRSTRAAVVHSITTEEKEWQVICRKDGFVTHPRRSAAEHSGPGMSTTSRIAWAGASWTAFTESKLLPSDFWPRRA